MLRSKIFLNRNVQESCCFYLYHYICQSDAIAVQQNEAFFNFPPPPKSIQTPKCAGSNGTNCRAVWHTQIDTLISKNICVVSIIIILISINSGYFSLSFACSYSNALSDSGCPCDCAVPKA